MARSGTGIGYTPSQTSTSMPGSFDEEQMAVARQRALLQQLANQPAVDSGYHGAHWVNPYRAQIAPALMQGLNALAQPEMDAQLQDVARRRGEYTDQLLSNPPQMEDIPAVPGSAGTGPVAPPPNTPGVEYDQNKQVQDYLRAQTFQQQGLAQDAAASGETGAPTLLSETTMKPLQVAPEAPMVPQSYDEFRPHVADQPMVPKWDTGRQLKWAGNLAASSPMGAKIAEKFIDATLAAPEKAAIRAEKSKAEMDKLRETIAGKVEAAQATLAGREYLQALGFNQQTMMQELKHNSKEELVRIAALLKPEKSTPVEHTTLQGYDVVTGRPVNRAPKDRKSVV